MSDMFRITDFCNFRHLPENGDFLSTSGRKSLFSRAKNRPRPNGVDSSVLGSTRAGRARLRRAMIRTSIGISFRSGHHADWGLLIEVIEDLTKPAAHSCRQGISPMLRIPIRQFEEMQRTSHPESLGLEPHRAHIAIIPAACSIADCKHFDVAVNGLISTGLTC